MKKNIYIFGYGSLLDFSSIEKTVLIINNDENDIDFLKKNIVCCSPILQKAKEFDKLIQIVKIKNIKRGWYHKIGNNRNKITKSWITLGAYECKGYSCNGTLFPVTEEQLNYIDTRETGYIRKIIEKKNITFIKGIGIHNDAIVYYYTVDKLLMSQPNHNYPIVQSYVDLCMTGCILIDQLLENKNNEFTIEFVKSTHKWKKYKYWINDRIYPRRPYIYVTYAKIIDTILNKFVVK